MKWFLLASMCLPSVGENLCVRMHSDISYNTLEECTLDRNQYFGNLVNLANEYGGTFKMICVDSFSIQEFVSKE